MSEYDDAAEPAELPPRLGDALDRVVRGLGAPGLDVIDEVFGHWAEVGGDLAGHARPVLIRGAELVVDVDEPVWGTELRYRQGEILDRLGTRIGAGRITSVEVRVRPGG